MIKFSAINNGGNKCTPYHYGFFNRISCLKRNKCFSSSEVANHNLYVMEELSCQPFQPTIYDTFFN